MTTNDNDRMKPINWLTLFWILGLLLGLTLFAFILSYEWILMKLGGA